MSELSLIKKLRVKDVIIETANAKTFVVEFMGDSQPVYEPGQFITLVFYTQHGEKRRSYSISSSPALNEQLCFTVKKIDNGEFSRFLLSHIKPGDILFTSGISGFFRLPDNIDHTSQYFFMAAGSGITACFPMIKTILSESRASVVLLYSNRSETDCIFLEQLKSMQRNYSNRFFIKFLFSDIADVYQSRLSKWLLEQLLTEYLIVPPAEALFYLCGPFEYMRMITITLLERVPGKNIMKEQFVTLPRLIIPTPPDTNAHSVLIHINNNQYKLDVQYPLSILATAKKNNIELPYSCESGRCGSCAATCKSGKIWMAYNEVLTDQEIEKGRVLTCQGFPIHGDAVIFFS